MQRVLVLTHDDDTIAFAVVRCLQVAQRFGVELLTGHAGSPLRRSRSCAVHLADLSTPALLLEAVRRISSSGPRPVVIPLHEPMIIEVGRMESALREFADLALIPHPRTCEAIDHKGTFHRLMRRYGLPVPISWQPSDGLGSAELLLLKRANGPVLAKPCLGYGGRGIVSFDSIERAIESVTTNDDVVLQEFIPGADIDCSILCNAGEVVALAIQRATVPSVRSYGAAIGLEFVDHESVRAVAERFAAATSWSGVAHLDMRIDQQTGDVLLIEVNPRYWATLMGSLARGVNFPAAHCDLSLGREVPHAATRPGQWLSVHSMVLTPGETLSVLRRHPRALAHVDLRTVVADPRVEATLVLGELRRRVASRLHRTRARLRNLRRGRTRRTAKSDGRDRSLTATEERQTAGIPSASTWSTGSPRASRP